MTTFAINTLPSAKSTERTSGLRKALKCHLQTFFASNDVVVINNIEPIMDANVSELELTVQSMELSMSSFAQEWDKEDDEIWNAY